MEKLAYSIGEGLGITLVVFIITWSFFLFMICIWEIYSSYKIGNLSYILEYQMAEIFYVVFFTMFVGISTGLYFIR